jgi:glycosyltransferase involved in cell wall biosynthesis
MLNRGLLLRTIWQRFALSKAASFEGCDLLFVPGGSYAGKFHPVVTMSRNLLPFEWRELKRFGWASTTLKLLLLRYTQSRSFRRCDGTIFLTDYAKDAVLAVTGSLPGKITTIPHGLCRRFVQTPRPQQPIDRYSSAQPFRLLYVSIIDQYKHQWQVVEAVERLRRHFQWPLTLDLVGPAYPPALQRLNTSLEEFDPNGQWVRYHGAVPYTQLHDLYAMADIGVFASSCENMPNILLETMGAGLPVACSRLGPMPQVLGDAGEYFHPEDPQSIADALQRLIESPQLREDKARDSYELVQSLTWERCAGQTFEFLAKIASQYKKECTSCAAL